MQYFRNVQIDPDGPALLCRWKDEIRPVVRLSVVHGNALRKKSETVSAREKPVHGTRSTCAKDAPWVHDRTAGPRQEVSYAEAGEGQAGLIRHHECETDGHVVTG